MENFKHIEFNALTGESTIVEDRPYTEEEIAEQARQATEQQIQAITAELAQLDTIVSRVEEDLIAFTKMPIYPSKQIILDRKNELRNLLKEL